MVKSKSPSAPVVLAGMPKPKADLDHAPIVKLLMGMLTGLAAERSTQDQPKSRKGVKGK